MDRFMMKLSMGLPDKKEELAILDRYMAKEPLEELTNVITLAQVEEARKEINQIFVHTCVREYMVELVEGTRKGDSIVMGVSPRGTLALLRCVKAYAWLNGRSFVTPDDVKAVAVPVLAHRIVMSYGYGKGNGSEKFVEGLLGSIPVPTEDFSA